MESYLEGSYLGGQQAGGQAANSAMSGAAGQNAGPASSREEDLVREYVNADLFDLDEYHRACDATARQVVASGAAWRNVQAAQNIVQAYKAREEREADTQAWLDREDRKHEDQKRRAAAGRTPTCYPQPKGTWTPVAGEPVVTDHRHSALARTGVFVRVEVEFRAIGVRYFAVRLDDGREVIREEEDVAPVNKPARSPEPAAPERAKEAPSPEPAAPERAKEAPSVSRTKPVCYPQPPGTWMPVPGERVLVDYQYPSLAETGTFVRVGSELRIIGIRYFVVRRDSGGETETQEKNVAPLQEPLRAKVERMLREEGLPPADEIGANPHA